MARLTLPSYFDNLKKLQPGLTAIAPVGTVTRIDDDEETFDFRLHTENRGESEMIEIVNQPFAFDYILVESNSGDHEELDVGDVVSVMYDGRDR